MNPIEIGVFRKQPGGYSAFIPHSFPPKGGFDFSPALLKKNAEASYLLGKLDGITKFLPDANYFLLMYVRKDAASSSQIEGTKATLVDAIEAEVKTNANIPADVDDILHYIRALNYGMKRVKADDFPVSTRLLRELHKELMHKARGTQFSDPGEYRTTQNWIGGTRPDNASFIPPPVDEMQRALGDLENFIHAEDEIPAVIKAGLVHAQFETIHPFLDGNGRTGRMLITFCLWQSGTLENPVLFLSSYFKKYQDVYYQRLEKYHQGHVSAWLDFFLDGVIEVANEATIMVDKITSLREKDLASIRTLGKRAFESASQVLSMLYSQPVVNVAVVQKWTGFNTRAGAQTVIDRLIDLKILEPKDKDKKYGQSYVYRKYLNIFTDNA